MMPTPNFPSSDMVTPQLEILVVHPDRVIEVQVAIGELHPKFRHTR